MLAYEYNGKKVWLVLCASVVWPKALKQRVARGPFQVPPYALQNARNATTIVAAVIL